MECGRACGERDGVLAADLLGGDPFDLVDVRADGTHPVGFVSLGDILDFVAVHRGAREPDFLFEPRHRRSQPRGYSGMYKVRRPLIQPALPDVKLYTSNINNIFVILLDYCQFNDRNLTFLSLDCAAMQPRIQAEIPDHPRQARTGVGNDKFEAADLAIGCLQNDVIC